MEPRFWVNYGEAKKPRFWEGCEEAKEQYSRYGGKEAEWRQVPRGSVRRVRVPALRVAAGAARDEAAAAFLPRKAREEGLPRGDGCVGRARGCSAKREQHLIWKIELEVVEERVIWELREVSK